MDDFFLLQAFEEMGEPAVQVKLIHNKFSGLPAGYCFVDFATIDAAHKAMLRLNGKIIPNSQPPHRFKLNHNNVKDAPRKEFSLFVGELSDDIDDYALFKGFADRYPSCHTAKVVLDSRGLSKGYGFVRFGEETDQQKALIEMQHTTGLGRNPIRVSLATPKRSGHMDQPPPNAYPHTPHNPGPYGPYGGYPKPYDNYAAYYQQYYANYYASQQQPSQQTTVTSTTTYKSDDSNSLEEPELTVDVEKYNRDYMAQSEEIFDVLEDSRWHPMDQWNSTVPATAR